MSERRRWEAAEPKKSSRRERERERWYRDCARNLVELEVNVAKLVHGGKRIRNSRDCIVRHIAEKLQKYTKKKEGDFFAPEKVENKKIQLFEANNLTDPGRDRASQIELGQTQGINLFERSTQTQIKS